MRDLSPVPVEVTRAVRDFVRKARKDAEQYDNIELHRLVADAYAGGWNAGHCVGSEEARVIP